jgi:hypothetical protein
VPWLECPCELELVGQHLERGCDVCRKCG